MKNINLINARKKKKLTQDELAKMLGYKGKSSVSNWENGHSTPPLAVAIKVAQILGEDVSFLFGSYVQGSHTEEQKEVS